MSYITLSFWIWLETTSYFLKYDCLLDIQKGQKVICFIVLRIRKCLFPQMVSFLKEDYVKQI
jgi:hypothetical protein